MSKKKIISLFIVIILVINSILEISFASTTSFKGGKFVTKEYYFKENYSDDALQRICFANNVDYVIIQNGEFAKYTKSDAYLVIDCGKYTKLDFQLLKNSKMASWEFSLDVYIDGEFISRITDFNVSPNVIYNYQINCENHRQIRLQLVSNQNKPMDEGLKEFIFIMNAKFS